MVLSCGFGYKNHLALCATPQLTLNYNGLFIGVLPTHPAKECADHLKHCSSP
jgi:hypothetical protein